ncbi:hypothetical protein EY643_12155 [Halioglobus maricola]|uniref:PepSY domain-containing protein n=1 Tax=Halioglobus maricola TaxID=2601894 RepID=A0A5P9NM69_9GAMM|nr:PepSY domain-containing protein [Halioglobus maricola]QFU76354.1 hypothetical protein EY643_12155 [Halioglobus maricola]
MKINSLHSLAGLIMAIPLLLWALTGFVFLTKPGYETAYEQLAPKLYAIEREWVVPPSGQWQELRLVRTTLGYHLLARGSDGLANLDPVTLEPASRPSEEAVFRLIDDATAHNVERYGRAVSLDNGAVTTDTGVTISFDWETLKLRQQGDDTRLINTLYKIHYLQWLTGPRVNTALGVLGLVLLLCLTGLGLFSYAKKRG